MNTIKLSTVELKIVQVVVGTSKVTRMSSANTISEIITVVSVVDELESGCGNEVDNAGRSSSSLVVGEGDGVGDGKRTQPSSP